MTTKGRGARDDKEEDARDDKERIVINLNNLINHYEQKRDH